MQTLFEPSKVKPQPRRGAIAFSTKGEEGTKTLEIKPGVHPIPDEDAAWLQQHPDYQRFVDMGALTLSGEAAKPGEAAPPGDDLKEMNTDEALEVIKASSDVAELERWDAADARKTVSRSIKERIAELTAA